MTRNSEANFVDLAIFRSVESAQGYIIRLRKLSDTSLIVTFFTLESGLIRIVAKGGRNPQNRFAGKLDLFVEGEIEWSRSRRSELHHLREITVRSFGEGLRGDYRRTVVGSYFGELVERAIEQETPIPEVFELLRRGYQHLNSKAPLKRSVSFFEKELARSLGLGDEAGYTARLSENLQGGYPPMRDEAHRLCQE